MIRREPRFAEPVNQTSFIQIMADHPWPEWVHSPATEHIVYTCFEERIYRLYRAGEPRLYRFSPAASPHLSHTWTLVAEPEAWERDFVGRVMSHLPDLLMQEAL